MTSDEFANYLFTYHHDGSDWSLVIRAPTEADAKERLAKLPLARYEGVLHAKIPAGLGGGMIARAWCAVANFFRGAT